MNPATEPTTDAREFARAVWHMFNALTAEGFTEKQALTMLANMIGAAFGSAAAK